MPLPHAAASVLSERNYNVIGSEEKRLRGSLALWPSEEGIPIG